MTDHPEQDMINALIDGALAGVDPNADEKGYDLWIEANKKISPEGRKEYEKQLKECIDQYNRDTKIMDNAIDTGTRH